MDYCCNNAIIGLVFRIRDGFEDYQAHVILPYIQRGFCSLYAVWSSRAQWPRAHERSPWATAPSSVSAHLVWSSALSENANGEKKKIYAMFKENLQSLSKNTS